MSIDKPLRIGILAGEVSGDILGAGLMAEIKKSCPDAVFEGIGGPLMTAQGLKSLTPMERLSVMGLIEPLIRLPELLRIRKNLYQHLVSQGTDVFIGIDSPDFNLGLEQKLRQQGILTVHYVSPSVWAWRQKRIHKILKAVDLMLALFPFEVSFYDEHQLSVKHVGHPLADEIPLAVDMLEARARLELKPDKKVLALLPGSRQNEVKRMAPAFLDTAREARAHFQDLQIVIPCANGYRKLQLEGIISRKYPEMDVQLFDGQSREVMAASDVVLLASGTATLEALLLKKPMIVCYRMAYISYSIISSLLKVPYFSLPNLLAGKKLVPEYSQSAVKSENLFPAVKHYLEEEHIEKSLHLEFLSIHQKLRLNASQQAAQAVLKLLCKRHS